jgi:hypothetical protein
MSRAISGFGTLNGSFDIRNAFFKMMTVWGCLLLRNGDGTLIELNKYHYEA